VPSSNSSLDAVWRYPLTGTVRVVADGSAIPFGENDNIEPWRTHGENPKSIARVTIYEAGKNDDSRRLYVILKKLVVFYIKDYDIVITQDIVQG